jgi:hypothetical protein
MRFSVQISSGTSAILNEVFHSFPQSSKANAGTMSPSLPISEHVISAVTVGERARRNTQ